MSTYTERSEKALDENQSQKSKATNVQNDFEQREKNLIKKIEELQITLNEKEAEIIRLTICIGDEKIRDSTPGRKRSSTTSSQHNYNNNSNSDIVRNMMIMDSPYFRTTQ